MVEGGRKGRKLQLKMSVQDVRVERRKGGRRKDQGECAQCEGRVDGGGGGGEGGKERRKGTKEEVMGKPAR